MRVLIIEDERSLALEMEDFLKKAFYQCDLAFTGKQARKLLADNPYNFVLLDLCLPDEDGLDILAATKEICSEASYIILSARSKVEDRIRALDLGADDFIPKPYSLLELQSRMHAITRCKSGIHHTKLSVGDFMIDLVNRSVMWHESEIKLSKKEFDLLSYMLLHRNRPLTRLQLSEHVWGSFSDEDCDSNYIDAHIKNLRKKMNQFAPTDWLHTMRGVGYKIRA